MITQMPKLGVAQRFGGRPPLIPIRFDVFSNKRAEVTGYTPYMYKEYMKFHTLAKPVKKHGYKTVAEVEGTVLPAPTKIRINSNCSIVEVSNG